MNKQPMTDAEIICSFMEPKPLDPTYYHITLGAQSKGGWWRDALLAQARLESKR